MFGKGSKLRSMITGECPRCQSESMYVNPNPYAVSETMKMHEECRHCGLRYKIEPNFFFGAMYVSYALSVAIGVAVFVISHYFIGAGLAVSFSAIFIGLIALMPPVARISRNIYINMFVSYRKEAVEQHQNSSRSMHA